MPQGSKWKMGCPNIHKAPGQSQLSKTDTGTLERNGPTRTRLIGKPHTTRRDALNRTNMPQESKQQMIRSNVHKAPGQSQLSKTDTNTLEQNDLTRMRLVGRPRTA